MYNVEPGRGLPYGSGLGLSRCLGPGECLHSFIHNVELSTVESVYVRSDRGISNVLRSGRGIID